MMNKLLPVVLLLALAGGALVLNSFSISCPLSEGGIYCRGDENCSANCTENCTGNSSDCICPEGSACQKNGSDENCSRNSCSFGSSGYKGRCSGR
ncbi:MAG: hypothetical protein MUE87_05670 [Methanothrix sp.]|nr:hypothetical protein [Methanothrix sp.]